jgi:hypothetical protein
VGRHEAAVAKYRPTVHPDGRDVIPFAHHDIDAITPQKSMTAKLPTISAVAAAAGWIHG